MPCFAEVLEFLVDEGCIFQREVVLRSAERDEVGSSGVADSVQSCCARVCCVGVGVVTGCPEEVELVSRVIPDC